MDRHSLDWILHRAHFSWAICETRRSPGDKRIIDRFFKFFFPLFNRNILLRRFGGHHDESFFLRTLDRVNAGFRGVCDPRWLPLYQRKRWPKYRRLRRTRRRWHAWRWASWMAACWPRAARIVWWICGCWARRPRWSRWRGCLPRRNVSNSIPARSRWSLEVRKAHWKWVLILRGVNSLAWLIWLI